MTHRACGHPSSLARTGAEGTPSRRCRKERTTVRRVSRSRGAKWHLPAANTAGAIDQSDVDGISRPIFSKSSSLPWTFSWTTSRKAVPANQLRRRLSTAVSEEILNPNPGILYARFPSIPFSHPFAKRPFLQSSIRSFTLLDWAPKDSLAVPGRWRPAKKNYPPSFPVVSISFALFGSFGTRGAS